MLLQSQLLKEGNKDRRGQKEEFCATEGTFASLSEQPTAYF